MAIGFVQARRDGATTGTSATVTLTATPTVGNYLYRFIAVNTGTVPTLPTGWVQLGSYVNTTASVARAGLTCRRIVQAGDTTAMAASTVASGSWNDTVVEYSGVDTTTPEFVTGSNASTSNVTTPTTPTLTTTSGNTTGVWIVASLMNRNYDTKTFSAGSFAVSAGAQSTTGVTIRASNSVNATSTSGMSATWDLATTSTGTSYVGQITVTLAANGVANITSLNPSAAAPATNANAEQPGAAGTAYDTTVAIVVATGPAKPRIITKAITRSTYW